MTIEKIYKEALDALSVTSSMISERLERSVLELRSNPTEDSLNKLIDVIDDLNQIRDERKQRMFAFGDESRSMVMRCYIFSVCKDWDENSNPILKINEMAEGVTMKDNPIKNLIVQYEDIDIRDRDFDRLKITLNNEGGINRK